MKGAGRLLFSSRKLGWRWQRLVLYINTIYMSHLLVGLQVPVAVQNVIIAYFSFVFWKHLLCTFQPIGLGRQEKWKILIKVTSK